MLIQILKHTPLWVFAMFFVLLIYGYAQHKTRLISSLRLFTLPAIMLLLSLVGVYSAFGLHPSGIAAWVIGIGVALWMGLSFGSRRGVSYSSELDAYHVPGSWLPLGLMMMIFFIKYAVGFSLARHFTFVNTNWFDATVSFVYGFLSGLFVSRALLVWRCAK
jgi:hypothetical protein